MNKERNNSIPRSIVDKIVEMRPAWKEYITDGAQNVVRQNNPVWRPILLAIYNFLLGVSLALFYYILSEPNMSLLRGLFGILAILYLGKAIASFMRLYDTSKSIMLAIPSPIKDNPRIDVYIGNNTVLVYAFHHEHFIVDSKRDVDKIVGELINMIDEIMQEKSISFGFDFYFAKGGGLTESKNYHKMVFGKRIMTWVSWNGTYNSNYKAK